MVTTASSRTRRSSKRTVSTVASNKCDPNGTLPSAVGFVELKNEHVGESSRQLNKSAKRVRPSSQRPKAVKVTSPEIRPIPFPSTTPHAEKPDEDALEVARKMGHELTGPSVRDVPTSPVHRRTRSMSMVLTSPLPLDTTQSNVRPCISLVCTRRLLGHSTQRSFRVHSM